MPVVCAGIVAVAVVACVPPRPKTTATQPADVDVSQLWRDPVDEGRRDLFLGPGEGAVSLDLEAPFTFVATDTKGYSRGFDVRDRNGLVWSVKLGPEAQTEVVVSRILWAIGYHQVPTYYAPQWTLEGGPQRHPGPGRFRPELPDRKVVGEWSWYENDFAHAQPFRGLIVANLVLNNWDWKTSNNKIYEVTRGPGRPVRQYVVRDLGASLGRTTFPRWLAWTPFRVMGQGTRNDLEGFESQGFIRRTEGTGIEFDYNGIHPGLVSAVTASDVAWTCRLLSKLTDAQWADAFRAGHYPPDTAARYIAKLKSKVAEGLALAPGHR